MAEETHGSGDAALWYSVLAIGVLSASASGTIVKFAHMEGVPTMVLASARNIIACVVLLPFLLRGSWREIARLTRRELLLITASGLILAFHFTMWIMSLERTNVMSATVFVTTTPIFVVLGSAVFLREKASPLIFVGIGISIIGGIVVAWADLNESRLVGNMMALVGAVGASAYMLIGRRVRPKLHLVPYIFVVYLIAGISLAIAAAVIGNSFTGYSPRGYLMMVLLGLIPSLIGHTAVNFVLRHLRSYIVSVAMLGEPVSGTLIAVIFIGRSEVPGVVEVLGSAAMLAGIYLSIRYANPSAKNS